MSARPGRSKFGVDILDGIGSTEMLHIFVSNSPGRICATAPRAAPVPGYELRLVDEKGGEVGDGEIGEMLVRGPIAAEGYWNQREKTRRTFEGAWTRTGDKYVRDADGCFIYCGRTDDMFKVSGIWVSPFEVEAALISHDAVLEAAVVPKRGRATGCSSPRPSSSSRAPATGDDAPREALKEHVKSASRPVEIPALDRVRRQPAEDRDGQDPALQAEGGSLRRSRGAASAGLRPSRLAPLAPQDEGLGRSAQTGAKQRGPDTSPSC